VALQLPAQAGSVIGWSFDPPGELACTAAVIAFVAVAAPRAKLAVRGMLHGAVSRAIVFRVFCLTEV
jgi:hypothetical protein